MLLWTHSNHTFDNCENAELFSVTRGLAKYDSQSPRTKNHSPHLRYL
jgi:hypothetical protein